MTINAPRQPNSTNPPIEVIHRAESEVQTGSPNSELESGSKSKVGVAKNKESDRFPEPLTPPGSAVEVEHLLPPDWTPPLYIRY